MVSMVVQSYSFHLFINLFPLSHVYLMFLIYLKKNFVILYTDDGSQDLGPKRMDIVKLGTVIEFWNCHNQISSKI